MTRTDALRRESGVLLHPTSLPGPLGCGDIGGSARAFVDFLAAAGQSVWQVLPIHPPGAGSSPYQALSAFAGSALLIDLEELVDLELIEPAELAARGAKSRRLADFAHAREVRSELLVRAFRAFEELEGQNGTRRAAARSLPAELAAFEAQEASWLGGWTLFAALKAQHGGERWTRWEASARDRRDLEHAQARLARERRFHAFLQLLFDRQWRALRSHAHARGIRILGDLPMFVAHDSADAWEHRELFRLNDALEPTHVSGAPPDAFNRDGQVWGHPLFDWERVRARSFDWWTARVRRSLALFDLVRLDHFVGYRATWEVPFGTRDASSGRYGDGPGAELFEALSAALGELPFVAENLGDVTREVEDLRARLGFPGMRVLQFAFGGDPDTNVHLPHRHVRECVAYTGTHDNDTTAGWFASLDAAGDERRRVLACTGGDERTVHWDILRTAWLSVADTAIAPVQDLLGLGSRARMNRPGTATRNWRFRLRPHELEGDLADRLRGLTEAAGRA